MKVYTGKSRIKRSTILFLLLLTVSSIMMVSSSRGKESLKISRIGFTVFSGIQKGFSYTITFFTETINSIGELRRMKVEYSRTLEKLSEYESIEKDFADLKRENEELRSQLRLSNSLPKDKIPAKVTGYDSSTFYNTVIIDRGSRHGVEDNMTVVAFQEGFQGLVGRVIETGYLSSKVLPLYDKKFSVASRLQNLRYEGIVSGTGKRTSLIVMNYVNKNASDRISYGDIVITSGMSSIYPSGIYIGKVRSVGAREYETSLELELEPVIDFSKLEYVFVLSKGSEDEKE